VANQAMQALITTTSFLCPDNIHASYAPEFADVPIDHKRKTAIKVVFTKL
jgi:stage V sporulation protein SpoVS